MNILSKAKRDKMIREDVNLEAASLIFFGLIQAGASQSALSDYSVSANIFPAVWNIFIRGISNVS
ncbi:hypothetical protein ACFL0T_06195 [Candidatus Omnitrophota bacterium]